MKQKFRRLTLDDGVWRFRIGSFEDRDNWKTQLTLELVTPAGRHFTVPRAEVDELMVMKPGHWHPILGPGLVRRYIEENRERI